MGWRQVDIFLAVLCLALCSAQPRGFSPERRIPIGLVVLSATLINSVSAYTAYGYSRNRRTTSFPIGAIFDYASKETRSAFSYEIMNINSKQAGSRVKLDANSQKIQTNDSYALATTMCSQMSSGIFVLFGTHSQRTLNTVKSFSKAFHMPYITPSTSVNMTGQELGFTLYMRPLYTKAIIDVIAHYAWTKVYYLFNSDEGLARLQQLFNAIASEDIDLEIKVYRVSDAEDAYNTLTSLDSQHEEGDKRILLDLPTSVCEQLLTQQKTDTRRVRFHYLLVGLGVSELRLDDYRHGGINMTGFQMVEFSNITVKKFFDLWGRLDPKTWQGAGQHKISFEAALAVDSVRLIDKALARLVARNSDIIRNTLHNGKFYNNNTEGIDCDSDPPVPWRYGTEIMKVMRETKFVGLSGNIDFDKYGLRQRYRLGVLEVNFNRGLAKIGIWTPEKGLEIQSPSLVRPKGNNTIANRTRIVTSILTEPYLMIRQKPDDGTPLIGNEQYEGYCADLVRKIAEIINIEYMIVPVKDGKYGAKDENGTWNGMVGELVRNEADLAIAPLTITSVRERVIDFSKPFMSLGISIMIKKPTKEIPGVFSFMYPLSYEIWMCVIFAYIGVSVVLFLVSRFSPFEWHIEDNTDGPTITNNFTIFNSLWFSLGAFMQQGCDIEPRSLSGRIVGSVWWFFTLIIISSYTANLAAFLTVERMQSPIESADDLAKQTEIKYGTVEGGSTMAFFQGSTIPVYGRMWSFMSSADPSVFVSSNEDGIKRVRGSNGRYAFLMESTTNDYINQRLPCDTMKVGSNLDSKGYGIGTPLGSDLRDRVTLAVLELRENGELQKLENKWWYDKGECGKEGSSTKKKDATSALKLSNVAGIFYILVGGLVLALVMAVLEFLYKSKVEARRRKTSFTNAVLSKARLSIKGKPERQTTAYTYAPAAQLISLDGYADGNTHTQV